MPIIRRLLAVFLFAVLSHILFAQDDLSFETVTVQASDELTLVGDLYLPDDTSSADRPVLMLFHMLGSHRGAYDPVIPDLVDNGYIVLNVDMRGHGETGGDQKWELTITDVGAWVDWLDEKNYLGEQGLAMIGASIGSNVALIGCADTEACVGSVALSPGLDYRGVQPEPAVVDGLAERSILLVAAHGDVYSADSVRQMFTGATGDVSARLYRGRSHGTSLFRTDYDSISHLILSWLAEQFNASTPSGS